MTKPRTYEVMWGTKDQLNCLILQVTSNLFAFKVKKETPEERLERKATEGSSSPTQNLQRLLRNHFLSKWRATELYPWFEQHAPGYSVSGATGEGVYVTFAHIDHLLLFKLTWT